MRKPGAPLGLVLLGAALACGGAREEPEAEFLENPNAFAPGTAMTRAGVRDPALRQAIVDFLKGF